MVKKRSSGSELVTKDYLDYRLTEFEERLTRKMEETISGSINKLYERIDPLLSEIENARIDRDMTTDKLEELDKRVKKLETS